MPRLLFAAALASGLLLGGTATAQRGTIPVNIESTPAGAVVFLDATTGTALGTTPMRRVRVPRGSHTLIFQREGHAEGRLPVNIRRRNETFRMTLEAQSVIDVRAGNERAAGATVRLDGAEVGVVPIEQIVTPGRHLINVARTGFVPFSQWVEVAGGQRLTLPVLLEPEAPRTGSILVASDVSGSRVQIDGVERGTTPTVIEGVSAGQHRVQVTADGPRMVAFDEQILVEVGQRSVVNATLRPQAPAGGSVRVMVNVPAAIVRVDGQPVGNSPATLEDVTPGDHIVEADADGYLPAQQPFSVEAGRRTVVALQLERRPVRAGVIVVNANVDGATVSVDGEDRGAPPVVIEDARAGTHAIVVSAPSRATYRGTCTTGPGEDCRIEADLTAALVDVRVVANVENATFYVDGEPVGPVPYEGSIPGGSHQVEVRADGHVAFRQQMVFRGGEEAQLVDAFLREEGELTEEEAYAAGQARADRHRQAVARSGAPLDDDYAIADFSLGWPYIFEGRLGIGILPWLEAGVAVRTFVRLTEFEIRAKVGYRIVPQFSAGVQITGGGGIGPSRGATDDEIAVATAAGTAEPTHPTNTAFATFGGLVTLHFKQAGNFTLWGSLSLTSDRWDWNGSDSDCRSTLPCPSVTDIIDGRQFTARAHLGGSFEFIVARNWNVWASFEAVFGPSRRVLGDVFGAGNADVQLYPRLGLTYKFNLGSD